MARQKCFKVGRVTVYLRGKTWYFLYTDQGRRCQKRANADRDASRQLAAQVNAQLEVGAPVATSFEPISVELLRQRWLDHHEQVRRSSVATIDRYRSASAHLLNFIRDVERVKQASHFTGANAEAFVRYLRQLKVTPNGHAKTAKRHLRDNGVKYVLEVSRTLFAFALKRRHLPPYSENPFAAIQIDRIPVEDAKPITIFTSEQERKFLEACDDWQRPIFATLILTGLQSRQPGDDPASTGAGHSKSGRHCGAATVAGGAAAEVGRAELKVRYAMQSHRHSVHLHLSAAVCVEPSPFRAVLARVPFLR